MKKKQESQDLQRAGTSIETLKQRKSIKGKLQINIAVLVIAIAVLCGAINSFLLYNVTNRNMQLRITETTEAYSQSVRNAIQIYKTEIESVAQNPDLTDSSKTQSQKEQILTQLAEDYGFDTVMITDSKGNTLDGVSVGDREYFTEAMAGNTYISTTLTSAKDEKNILIISSKVKSNGYDGIVFAILDSSAFSKMISNIAIGKSGYGFITDKEGKIIAHKNQETVDNQVNYIQLAEKDSTYSGLAEMIQNMVSGKTGIQKETFNGSKLTIGYSPIADTDGWSIGVAARTSELMTDFFISVAGTIILAVLLVMVSFFVAARIANPIVNPIISLVRRIELLNKGDLHTDVPQFQSEDEIGILSSSLTHTVKALKAVIGETSSVLIELQKGDCTQTSKLEYVGDFIPLKTALNGVIANLNTIFSNFRMSTDQVAIGADQVSSAAQLLASGTTEQAATVEELNASVANVAQQAEENSETVNQASKYVEEAGEELIKGNTHMNNLNEAMQEISESSQQIFGISKVIEDIAFQTNILALNAAIEAARAGEVGKGFAVVADEVRNLAAKVADASKQATVLLQHSSEVVEDGGRLSVETAEILKRVEEKSSLIAVSMNRIKEASSQQADAIEQINTGLAQVSSVVQTNAATAEESSASSEELAAQAQTMQKEISWIKLMDQKESTPPEETPQISYETEPEFDIQQTSFIENDYSKY